MIETGEKNQKHYPEYPEHLTDKMLHRNYLKKTPSGPPHLVVDSHATGRILLQNFCDSIGEPFILQFRFLFTLFFLNEKEKNGSRLVKDPTYNSQENQRILSE